jgi:peptidase C13-like protein
MSSGTRSRCTAALLALLILATAQAAGAAPKVAIVSFGLFGDQSVFESEAKGAAKIAADRFANGGPVVVHFNTKKRTEATPETLTMALDSVAREIDRDNDVLMVILTSHGSRAGLVVKAGAREGTLSPALLSVMLNQTGVRHRAVVISACYSGVFIPHLASENTMVITAADADHPSFGCQDGARWTYFGEAFFDQALRRAATLRDAFKLARTLVLRREQQNRFVPSNPQIAGGRNVEHLLRGGGDRTAEDKEPMLEPGSIPVAWPRQNAPVWQQFGTAPWPEPAQPDAAVR